MHPYRWTLDTEALVLVPALVIGYVAAIRAHPTSRARRLAFAGGVILLLVALVSPLEHLALHYLLLAHLLQNVILAEWAPGLVVLGVPPTLARNLGEVQLVRRLTRPPVGLLLWLLVYGVWHVPAIYDAALRHPTTLLHLEHATYFGTGILLWWPLLHGAPHHVPSGGRAAYLFAAFVLASPIGLLLALLPKAVYDFYADAPRLWGLSPLADQQIAGLTMAAEQAIVFFAVFSLFFLRFLREQEAQEMQEAPNDGRA